MPYKPARKKVSEKPGTGGPIPSWQVPTDPEPRWLAFGTAVAIIAGQSWVANSLSLRPVWVLPVVSAALLVASLAVYLPDQGAYAYRVLGQADVIPFGTPGTGQSLPAPADYTGSGHVELGVYLPSLGVLAYRPAFGSDVYEAFGLPGPGQTIPVTRVILSPFPGSGGGSAHAMAIPVPDVVADGLAPLDLITRPDKKAKGGRSA